MKNRSVRQAISFCALGVAAAVFTASARADDWSQWLGPTRAAVRTATGIRQKFPQAGPTVKWRVQIGGGYAGPAVAKGRVFVMDYLTKGNKTPNPFSRSKLEGTERVLCYSAADGKLLWKHEYDCPYNLSYP